jgi:hypothetical protein
MKKLINGVETLLGESLSGFAAAHAGIVVLGEEGKFVRRRDLKHGKVGLLSGGGSGHEPLHAGFVGLGMLDAACPGQVFTSPTPDQMLAAARDIAALADYTDAADPAVLSLVVRSVEHGKQTGREVSLCGDAASDPALIPALLGTGLRSLSVSAPSVGLVKAAIADALDR